MVGEAENRIGAFRIVLFLMLFVCVNLWTIHHFGISYGSLGWFNGVAIVLGGGLALVDKLFTESETRFLQKWLRKFARLLVSSKTLLFLYLVSIVVALTYSSAWIIREQEGEVLNVRLTPLNSPVSDGKDGTMNSGDQMLRFGVLTTVFGRSYRLEVEGFLPEIIEVYPLTGTKIYVRKDLRLHPAILLRPSIPALGSLASGGWLVLADCSDGESREILRAKGERTSYLIGRDQPIPERLIGNWRMELRAVGLTDGEVMARTLMAWYRPTRLPLRSELHLGRVYCATILTRVGKIVAEAEFTLTDERLIDSPMITVH